MKAKPINNQDGERMGYWVHCPGCDQPHLFNVEKPSAPGGPLWGFNGNLDTPTFTPSMKVFGRDTEKREWFTKCHSFVTEGRIKFLTDCTHGLAGREVELPEIEE